MTYEPQKANWQQLQDNFQPKKQIIVRQKLFSKTRRQQMQI